MAAKPSKGRVRDGSTEQERILVAAKFKGTCAVDGKFPFHLEVKTMRTFKGVARDDRAGRVVNPSKNASPEDSGDVVSMEGGFHESTSNLTTNRI